MKAFVLITGFALSAFEAYAQGTVTFANVVTLNPIPYVVWGGGVGAGLTGTRVSRHFGIRAGLYYDAGAGFRLASSQQHQIPVGGPSPETPTSALDGRFVGPAVTIPGLPPGQVGLFQVRVWSGTFSNYELAVAGGAQFLGQSESFLNLTGGVPDPVTGVPSFPASLIGFTGMAVYGPIPEPDTVALTCLGLVVLLFSRGRRVKSYDADQS